jgi:hypothetical protein
MPPARIVPALADEGMYLASESSFSRVLREAGQNRHRSRAGAPPAVPAGPGAKSAALVASHAQLAEHRGRHAQSRA